MNSTVLIALVAHFGTLSLLAFGGVGALTPEIHRVVVDQQHWMTAREFVDYFAIAQATPGPNALLVTLIGWHVAGIVGAVVATLAISLPGAIFTWIVAGIWQHFRHHPMRQRIQLGLAPLTVGLVCCTAWVLIGLADHNAIGVALTMGSAVISWRSKLNPLWLLAFGAALGAAGFV
ncbi:MAG TPA: chromate transporter [Rhodocyclaceae bacterium]|nr:chromate transporter [Rhodocyclaceae bacterium]